MVRGVVGMHTPQNLHLMPQIPGAPAPTPTASAETTNAPAPYTPPPLIPKNLAALRDADPGVQRARAAQASIQARAQAESKPPGTATPAEPSQAPTAKPRAPQPVVRHGTKPPTPPNLPDRRCDYCGSVAVCVVAPGREPLYATVGVPDPARLRRPRRLSLPRLRAGRWNARPRPPETITMTASEWRPMTTAPIDGSRVRVLAVLVDPDRYVKAVRDLPVMKCEASWHPDAGWCVDEFACRSHGNRCGESQPPNLLGRTPNRSPASG